MKTRTAKKINSERFDSEASGSEKSKQERVTLRVRRNILPNKERLKTTKGKDKTTLNKNEGGNEPSAKPKPKTDITKKDKSIRQNKDMKNKETFQPNKDETASEAKINNSSDTSVIPKALDIMKIGLENKIDSNDKKTNEI